MSLLELIFHSGSNVSVIKESMMFKEVPKPVNYPSPYLLKIISNTLKNSSCAVVGASSSLLKCKETSNICSHDVIIRVNHHEPRFCDRTDIQVVNAFACVNNNCKTPTLFRLRTEWNVHKQSYFKKESWLSSGYLTNYTKHVLSKEVKTKRCCNTAGGTAVAFAIHACKKVTLYGLGGVGKGYLRNVKKRAPSGVHNLQGEKEWYDLLEKKRIVSRVCK